MPSHLKQQIIRFLELEAQKTENPNEVINRKEVIEYFKNSKGQCYGIAVMQAYGRKIEDENRNKAIKEPADDADFFNSTKKTLLEWDESQSLSDDSRSDIERFISHILFYQRADLECLIPN